MLDYLGAADHLSDLFASDAMLASQFVALRKSVDPSWRPIQKLMLAVLLDAIDSLFVAGRAPSRCRLRSEASRWLFDEAAAGPFSFAWICDGLGIEPSYLRAGVRSLDAKLARSRAFKPHSTGA
jgi:hypothetical protein